MNKNPTTDETDAWPYIRWIEKLQRWKVDARTKHGGKRRFFMTKAMAQEWAQLQRARRQIQGDGEIDDKELALYGLTVSDAIKFTLEHYRRHRK